MPVPTMAIFTAFSTYSEPDVDQAASPRSQLIPTRPFASLDGLYRFI